MSRRAGVIFLKVNGEQFDAKGNFEYNLGGAQREAIVGADKIHGYKETPGVPFIAGEITDSAEVDLAAMQAVEDATITLELGNGKVVVLRNGWAAGEFSGNTEEANIGVRYEGLSAEEIS